MTLKERIQEDRKNAMINREIEKKTVLGTLLGELDRKSKTPTDTEVIAVIKKMMEGNVLTKTTHENEYLSIYLPKLMSENQIEEIITSYVEQNNLSGMKSMGVVMNFLKNNYAGQYEGKIASNITKKILS
jgi:uncharacterized protein YqeY